ncbi:chromate transporter, partial [Sedimentibacter sp. B4]|uniref:chromate transporter n=1 Tax=Sedimentibacter sp. B4 TaxID=304766 RepID=UPI0018DDEBFF
PSLAAIILMADLHGRIQGHKAVQAVIKGLQAAFIGLIASVALQFALKSLLTWQEWLIFVAGFVYIAILKKNSVWAILATIAFSFLFLQ